MTNFQLAIGFLLTFCMVLRPILYKPAAQFFKINLSVLFTSVWLLIGLVITFPILGHLFTDRAEEVLTSPYLLLSVIKGVSLWLLVKLQQSINKESTSSSTFYLFTAMALASLLNNMFFHEGLKVFQLVCVLGFGVLGCVFFIYGDAKRLSRKNKIAFILATFICALFGVEDHLAIPRIGWYPHLLVSSIFMFLMCFFDKISKQDIISVFKNKILVKAGVFYTVSEFLIIYASTNILPVSFVALFMRLATPIVMIISAIKYKEQTLKNQLVFGIISLMLALPLILIK